MNDSYLSAVNGQPYTVTSFEPKHSTTNETTNTTAVETDVEAHLASPPQALIDAGFRFRRNAKYQVKKESAETVTGSWFDTEQCRHAIRWHWSANKEKDLPMMSTRLSVSMDQPARETVAAAFWTEVIFRKKKGLMGNWLRKKTVHWPDKNDFYRVVFDIT